MTKVHRAYRGLQRILPKSLARYLRSAATAFLAPNFLAYRSGHWRSSFARRAVDRIGRPIPWYTYPSLEYLQRQSFVGKRILEFGGGQSTLWWAARADYVMTIETDEAWAKHLQGSAPRNATVIYLDLTTGTRRGHVAALQDRLRTEHPEPFDIIVIDGAKYRSSYAKLARDFLSRDGAIICDNAEGFGIFEALRNSGLSRVDFYGIAPGTIAPAATSIYFNGGSFLFDNSRPIGGDILS